MTDLKIQQLEQRVTEITPPRRYDPFTRRLTHEELLLLHDVWRPLLNLQACEKSHIRYWHDRIVNVERGCSGRLAGNVQDAVLRAMVAVAAPGPKFEMLEIGTLFGVNAAATWDIAACVHESARVTIVDPLDGYYGTSRRDVATGLRICRRTVDLNLRRIGMTGDDVRIIQSLSEATGAAEQAAGQYGYMFIDGDHSYEGVLRDWSLYGPMLVPGGYVLFDNYRDGSWPEVTRAVDELAQTSGLEFLGHAWCTAVFRRPGNP